MAKYHLNKEGFPAVCKASARPCPVGGDHYDSKLEALEAAESLLEDEEGLFSSHKKPIYHVDENGSAMICEDEKKCTIKPFKIFANVHTSDMDMIFGAAQAFRASIGAVQDQNVPEEKPARGPLPQAEDSTTTQARQIRAVATGSASNRKQGDEMVIDGVRHSWSIVGGDGCRTSFVYDWRPAKDKAVPPPVHNEERIEAGEKILYQENTHTGVIERIVLGPVKKAVLKPINYGSNAWARGGGWSC